MDRGFEPVPVERWTPFEATAAETLSWIEDIELRVAIGSLFGTAHELVERGEIDVVVLAARRLVCLYQLLIRNGMPELGGLVASDRYLEADPDLVGIIGRPVNVLVLDDSVVLGTTLRKLTLRLQALVGSGGTVRSAAVCVDDHQVASYLLEGLGFEPIHHRQTSDVEAYSAQIVRCLFEGQVPFFADFPITRVMTSDLGSWEKFLTSDDWFVADVTGPGLAETGTYAVALVPTEATISRFLTRCHPAAAGLVDAFKIRLYIRPCDEGVRAVVVPIAMVAPASPSVLDEAKGAVVAHLEADSAPLTLEWRTWDPEAKHRLLQLYVSVCALAELWPRVASTFDVEELGPSALEALPVALYFGPAAPQVAEAFIRAVTAYESTEAGFYPVPGQLRLQEPVPAWFLLDDPVQQTFWAAQEILDGIGLPPEPQAGQLTKAGLVFSHAVASVFGFINNNYELPQREEIRSLGGLTAFEEWLGDGSRRVLSQGITLRELDSALLPTGKGDSAWSRSLVSLAVDEGNDLGVMVPVTRYDAVRDVVARTYRIGETAPLAGCPLVDAVMGDQAGGDYFIEAMLSGVSAQPQTTELANFVGTPHWAPSPMDRMELERWIRSTIPGRPIERFDGRVLGVTEEGVEAELVPPAEDDERHAYIPLDRVDGAPDGEVRVGTRFTWTTFELRSPGRVRRTIDIKVRQLPRIDREAMVRDAAALSPDEDDAAPG
jgi:hypothetical protein